MPEHPTSITVCNDRQIRFSVPADARCLSTFVLLEQGRWFEKEIDFIYRYATSGMTALDVGANIGAYTLPLAQLVGPDGRVVAYEPGAFNRDHLAQSLALNQCNNVTVSTAALSDFAGTGWLKIEHSGELNQLVPEQTGADDVESVQVTTLDHELDKFDWAQVDFMKIDAEGQEAAIIRGGQRFFKRYSPLILFEVNHFTVINRGLIDAFLAMGFDTYRALGDGSMLVPVDRLDKFDFYEVNLFAARPDRASSLAERGLLARPGAISRLSDEERRWAVASYCALPFAQAFEIDASDVEQCPFGEALVAYSAYRFLDSLSPDRRFAFLQEAHEELARYCEACHSTAALSSLSRVAHDLGHRAIAVEVLTHMLDTESFDPDQPFLPPSPHFDADQHAATEGWFVYATKEALESLENISSFITRDTSRLEWMAAQDAASDRILKRLTLADLKRGQPADRVCDLLARLRTRKGDDHSAWCDAVQLLMAGR